MLHPSLLAALALALPLHGAADPTAGSARVFVDRSQTLFVTDEKYLSFSFLPSQPDSSTAYSSTKLLALLKPLGPAYYQWQYGNGAAYNITGGSLSPCGNATHPARCAGPPGSPENKPYRVLQREDFSATLDFVASIPEAKFFFYVSSNYGDGPACPSSLNMSYTQRVDCSSHAGQRRVAVLVHGNVELRGVCLRSAI